MPSCRLGVSGRLYFYSYRYSSRHHVPGDQSSLLLLLLSSSSSSFFLSFPIHGVSTRSEHMRLVSSHSFVQLIFIFAFYVVQGMSARHASISICDFYANTLFQSNTVANQKLFINSLVNTAFAGNCESKPQYLRLGFSNVDRYHTKCRTQCLGDS
jgi:hypothetical protein